MMCPDDLPNFLAAYVFAIVSCIQAVILDKEHWQSHAMEVMHNRYFFSATREVSLEPDKPRCTLQTRRFDDQGKCIMSYLNSSAGPFHQSGASMEKNRARGGIRVRDGRNLRVAVSRWISR